MLVCGDSAATLKARPLTCSPLPLSSRAAAMFQPWFVNGGRTQRQTRLRPFSLLQVWNHRPLRADEPDHRAWVQERSTLDGMGPGPVGCLTKLGRRMFAGGSDGGIRVYM